MCKKELHAGNFIHRFFLTVLVASAGILFPVFGGSVSHETAVRVASRFIPKNTNVLSLSKTAANGPDIPECVLSPAGDTLAYIVSIPPSGFVIVPASDEIEPVIAYSSNTAWQADSEWKQQLTGLLQRDVRQRITLSSQFSQEKKQAIRALWNEALDQKTVSIEAYAFRQWPPENSTSTGGWIETAWHQDAPYNQFCPMDPVYGLRSVTGCVATSIAQVLNYHRSIGQILFFEQDSYSSISTSYRYIQIDGDSLTYDFPSFTRLNGYLETIRNKYQQGEILNDTDLAALHFACGVVTETDYSYEGSGALLYDLNLIFLGRFGYWCARYQEEGFRVDRDHFYIRLKKNMMEGYPAILSLQGDVNHALICDGYNSDGFYHLNFGWGDESPHPIRDVWYFLPEEMPDGFDLIDAAVYDIKPYSVPTPKLIADQDLINLSGGESGRFTATKTFRLTNTTDIPLQIDYVVASGPFFISGNVQIAASCCAFASWE